MSRLSPRLLAPALAILIVAACSQPSEQPPAGPQGTVHEVEGAPVMLGAAMFFVDITGPMALDPASVIEAEPGLYLGPVTGIGADGSFALELPEGSELPAALMEDADYFVYNALTSASCSLVASDPTVDVTTAAFELVTVPGIALLSVEGLIPAIATAEELSVPITDEEVFAARFQTWVYADGPTTVVTDPAVCDDAGSSVSVDVSLASGWNQLEWTILTDELGDFAGLALGNSTADELHVLPMYAFITSIGER